MIADALNWKPDRITDEIEPKIADADVASESAVGERGQVCGSFSAERGYVDGEPRIRLRLGGVSGRSRVL